MVPCASIKIPGFVLGFAISRTSYLAEASARDPGEPLRGPQGEKLRSNVSLFPSPANSPSEPLSRFVDQLIRKMFAAMMFMDLLRP